MKELISIQSELKAPKGQWNKFGKYNYRSCEDILEAVKPLCVKHEVVLTITDDIIVIQAQEKNAITDEKNNVTGYDESGARVYVKATVQIINKDQQKVSVSAFARESLTKKGMDSSQITGAASSYARKYALNGLFLIDDNKDADNNNKEKQPETKPKKKLPADKFGEAVKFLKGGKSMDELKSFYEIDADMEIKLTNAINE